MIVFEIIVFERYFYITIISPVNLSSLFVLFVSKKLKNSHVFLLTKVYNSCFEHNILMVPSVQCVPYLIAMGTDPEASMRNKADQQLVEIDKKYTGFIHVS